MENWDFQGSWGGATVRQDYAKMMMTHSAVEMLHDSALYKFIIDIDIYIDI